MTTGAPADGGTKPDKLKEKVKHPFSGLREKLRDTKLDDVKVSLSHKKYVQMLHSWQLLTIDKASDWEVQQPGECTG